MPKNHGHWVKKPFRNRMFKDMTEEELEEWINEQKERMREDRDLLIQSIKGIKQRLFYNNAIITKDLQLYYKGKVFQFKKAEDIPYYLLCNQIPNDIFAIEITNDPVILAEKEMLCKHIDNMLDHSFDNVMIDNMLVYRDNDKILAFKNPFRFTYSISNFKKVLTGELIYPQFEFLGKTFNDDLKELLDKSKFSSN